MEGGSITPWPTPNCLHDTHFALGTNFLLCYFVATPLDTRWVWLSGVECYR
jgi:hypothetical protein